MSSEPRVVIVGAGPAGANAALALAAAGVRSIVIDDNPRAGGQIFRIGPDETAGPVKPDPRGVRLRARLAERADMIEHRAGHQVIGATPERRLTVAPNSAAPMPPRSSTIWRSGWPCNSPRSRENPRSQPPSAMP